MSEQKALLEVKGLKKYFSTPRGMLHAVDDVSFTLDKGKTLGVVGESGCTNRPQAVRSCGCWSPPAAKFCLKGKT